jgi:hypothetical protein
MQEIGPNAAIYKQSDSVRVREEAADELVARAMTRKVEIKGESD